MGKARTEHCKTVFTPSLSSLGVLVCNKGKSGQIQWYSMYIMSSKAWYIKIGPFTTSPVCYRLFKKRISSYPVFTS